jgi:hypothetical protein
VSDDLWNRVRSRREDTEGKSLRFDSGRLSGRPPKNATKNLLAGLASCGVCGGGLVVETSSRKNGRQHEYVCHRHRHNSTCGNALRIPIAEMNEAVLRAIEEHALTPEAIEQVIQLTERDDVQDRQDALTREMKEIERRIKRNMEAIEVGGDLSSLVVRQRELEARRQSITREIESLRPIPRLAPSIIENRLADWRRLLRQSTTQGRAVLQRILRGRMTFVPHPNGRGYDFTAPTRFDKLFTGVVADRPPHLPTTTRGVNVLPEDTPDFDYGVLLERVQERIYGKGVASPTGFEPVFWP